MNLILDLIKWCFNVDEIRTTTVISRAIDGTALATFDEGGPLRSWALKSTNSGVQGAFVVNTIAMKFSSSKPHAMAALSGKLDHCLTQDSKDRINQIVKDILAQDGYYGSYETVSKNKIDIVTHKLSEEEIRIFSELVY